MCSSPVVSDGTISQLEGLALVMVFPPVGDRNEPTTSLCGRWGLIFQHEVSELRLQFGCFQRRFPSGWLVANPGWWSIGSLLIIIFTPPVAMSRYETFHEPRVDLHKYSISIWNYAILSLSKLAKHEHLKQLKNSRLILQDVTDCHGDVGKNPYGSFTFKTW